MIPRLVTLTSLVSLILGFPIVLGLNYGILHPIKGLLDEAVPAVDVILVCPPLIHRQMQHLLSYCFQLLITSPCLPFSIFLSPVFVFDR